MIIKSFGCSFIFGTDLADVNARIGQSYSVPSTYTWPSLLAQHLNFEYQCFARPGSGNLRILEKVLSHALEEPRAIFIIGWSWIDRFDFTIDLSSKNHVHDLTGKSVWRTLMPVDTETNSKFYYKYLHSCLKDKLTNLIYIKTAVDFLQQKKIKFVMTYMDDSLFASTDETTPVICNLQDYLRPYMTTFAGKTFLEYSREKGFEISPTLHPLEPAHQAAFELIKSYNLI